MESDTVGGSAGRLRIKFSPSSNGRWAILCHPHPLYGGTMDDAVLEVARDSFAAAGGGTVLFNFRGVGGSDGVYDDGRGEVDDVLAIVDWLHQTRSPPQAPALAGYSFGASVAWRAAAQRDVAAVVLIAPPMGTLPFPAIDGIPAAVVMGSEDAFVDAAALREWRETHAAGTVEVIEIDGADHFFGGHRSALRGALDDVLDRLSAR